MAEIVVKPIYERLTEAQTTPKGWVGTKRQNTLKTFDLKNVLFWA